MKRYFYLAIVLFSLAQCSGQTDKIDNNTNIEDTYNKNISDSILATGWYYISDTATAFKRQLDKTNEYYFIAPRPIVTKQNFIKIEIFDTDFKGQYKDYTGLKIILDEAGTLEWSIATIKAINKRLALIIDNKLVNAPKVNMQITNGTTSLNRTEYSKEEIEAFKKIIK
jgi:preprotein translocase subunit SecD